jgi:hypothetical protein
VSLWSDERHPSRKERKAHAKDPLVGSGLIGATTAEFALQAREKSHFKQPEGEDLMQAWDPDAYKQPWQKPADSKSIGSAVEPVSTHLFTYGGYETTALGQKRFFLHHPNDCLLYGVYISSSPLQRPELNAKRWVLFRAITASFKVLANGSEKEIGFAFTYDTSQDTREVIGPWLSPISDGPLVMDISYPASPVPGHPSRRLNIQVTPVFAVAAYSKDYTKTVGK